MKQTGENTKHLGMKHWFLQTIPPFLMLSLLFLTDKGTALVFLAGLFIIPVLISFLSIIFKLINLKKRKYYLLRPILTIVSFILMIMIANWTYYTARDQAIAEANTILELCNTHMLCPQQPPGWQTDGRWIQKNDLGTWFSYSASYYYKPESFEIRLYQGPDLGDIITGGINTPLEVNRYLEK